MPQPTCVGPECTKPAHYVKLRLCKTHEMQMRRSGELKAARVPTAQCSLAGCGNKHKAKGLCAGHYMQSRRGADLTDLIDRRRVKPQYRGRRDREEILARDSMGRKKCRTCEEWSPESNYAKRTGAVDGLGANCKPCALESNRRVRARNYGITLEEQTALLEAQGNRCAVCKASDHGATGWHTDHDHACCPSGSQGCGECVRGILCRACNLALGMVKDNPETLRALALYLEAHAASRG